MVSNERGCGWRPSPPKLAHEKPDYTLDAGYIALATTPPPSSSAASLVIDILDQGYIGSCTTNAAAQAIRASHVKQLLARGLPLDQIRRAPPPILSRLMLYWLARQRWGEAAWDDGTFIRTVFEQANLFGFCPEAFWPYDPSKFAQRPPTAALVAAIEQRRPTKYVRITSSGANRIDDIKRAVASGYLVEFGTPVTEKFVNGDVDFSRPIPTPGAREKRAGGHAMVVAAYDSDGAVVANSWGTGWGNDGWVTLSWDYIAWGETEDLWIVEAAPPFAFDLVEGA